MPLVIMLTAFALLAFIAVAALAIVAMESRLYWDSKEDAAERAALLARLTHNINEVWAAMKMRDDLERTRDG